MFQSLNEILAPLLYRTLILHVESLLPKEGTVLVTTISSIIINVLIRLMLALLLLK